MWKHRILTAIITTVQNTGQCIIPCEWFSFTRCQLYFHAGWMLCTDVPLVHTFCWEIAIISVCGISSSRSWLLLLVHHQQFHSLTLSVLMSIKVNIRGRVLKSTKVDVRGRVPLPRYMSIKVDSFVALCSKGLYIHIQHWEQYKKIIQHCKS